MGICVFAAASNGNLESRPASVVNILVFVFAFLAVLIQATIEEIESRAFVFGKMNGEGVPLIPAAMISAFFFAYLHAANPGFGLLPLQASSLSACCMPSATIILEQSGFAAQPT